MAGSSLLVLLLVVVPATGETLPLSTTLLPGPRLLLTPPGTLHPAVCGRTLPAAPQGAIAPPSRPRSAVLLLLLGLLLLLRPPPSPTAATLVPRAAAGATCASRGVGSLWWRLRPAPSASSPPVIAAGLRASWSRAGVLLLPTPAAGPAVVSTAFCKITAVLPLASVLLMRAATILLVLALPTLDIVARLLLPPAALPTALLLLPLLVGLVAM